MIRPGTQEAYDQQMETVNEQNQNQFYGEEGDEEEQMYAPPQGEDMDEMDEEE